MSPRTEEQFETIREERKKQIMQVALELIADQGFQKVSIAKIAKMAKISKGLMYNYFVSKEELILEIMNDGFTEFTKYFDPNKDGVLTKEELHYFIDKIFDVLKSNTRFWRMYFMVMFQPDVYKLIEPKIAEMLASFMATAADYFYKNNYEDPEAELRMFAALMDGIGLHYVLDPVTFPLEGVKKKLHAMYR
jgi:AcrR family transcriptional regulator